MKNNILILFFLSAAFYSCKKGPGEGGQTTILGKIWEQRYLGGQHNDTLDRWAIEQDVYIIYGNELSYGNRTRTGLNGLYEFKYLRAGDYTVYFYSDSTIYNKKLIRRVVSIPDDGITDLGTDTIIKLLN